jgi:hypothetical protein
MDMRGMLSEHEENTGTLRLHDHRFFDHLDLSGMDTLPFREMWMREGVESYHELLAMEKPVSGKLDGQVSQNSEGRSPPDAAYNLAILKRIGAMPFSVSKAPRYNPQHSS